MYSLFEYYREYNNIYDPIFALNSTQRLVDFFYEIGLVEGVEAAVSDSLKRIVFILGNKNEVYSKPEIDFINSFSDVSILYESVFSRRNRITTRLIVSEICDTNPIRSCIILTQIINKALQGFNVVFMITKIGIIISIPILGEQEEKKYQLSKPICNYSELEDMCNSIILAPDNGRFIDYYLYLKAITSPNINNADYEEKLKQYNRGPNFEYIRKLRETGDLLKVDFSEEIQCYLAFFDCEPEPEKTFEDIINEEHKNVFPIISNPLNTMELKLESDELVQLVAFDENTASYSGFQEEVDDSLLGIDDPEELIKQLKRKYGI